MFFSSSPFRISLIETYFNLVEICRSKLRKEMRTVNRSQHHTVYYSITQNLLTIIASTSSNIQRGKVGGKSLTHWLGFPLLINTPFPLVTKYKMWKVRSSYSISLLFGGRYNDYGPQASWDSLHRNCPVVQEIQEDCGFKPLWKHNATQCIWMLLFPAKTVQAERKYFCPSLGVNMYIARGDLSTAAALLTAGLLIPKCIVQRCFWLLTVLQICISVFLWSINGSFLLLVCVCRTDLCARASFLTGSGHRHFWEIIHLWKHFQSMLYL